MSGGTAMGRVTSPAVWISRSLRELGHAPPAAIPGAVERLKMILAQQGADFDTLADRIERIGIDRFGPELDNDKFGYDDVRVFFERHQAKIPLSEHPWLGDLLRRLATGLHPSVDEKRRLNNMRRRLALEGRLP